MRGNWTLFLGIVFYIFLECHTSDEFEVQTSLTGYFYVNVKGTNQFLVSDPNYLVVNNKLYITEKTLVIDLTSTKRSVYTDKFGDWDVIRYIYYADDVPIEFSIKQNAQLPVAIFTQRYLVDVNITADLGNITSISGFPSFYVPFYNQYGYLSYGNRWGGDYMKRVGGFKADTVDIPDGIKGSGPLCIFDEMRNAVVISPLNNFMTATTYLQQNKYLVQATLYYGINSAVRYVPAGYEQQTVLYYSSNGINAAFEGWGNFLRKWVDKRSLNPVPDITLTSLGYWTNYGSYYYNNIASKSSYENVLTELVSGQFPNVPYKYIELDNWWNNRDNNGVLSWQPNKTSLPNGFSILNDKLHIQTALNAGKWSPNNIYSTIAGGQYHFVSSQSAAVPTTQAFWDYLFTVSKSYGMKTIVLDDMADSVFLIPELSSNLTLGRDWLVLMGKSAEQHGINIQYSNALPAHLLQALEIPAVTQARVSNNYMYQNDQWKIGITSILANALGLAPSKDTFWTKEQEPGNIYGLDEKRPKLQNLISTLSMGPVGFGDSLNYNDAKQAASYCCREDGVVLRPGRPITTTDAQILKMALNVSTIPEGEIMSTTTVISNLTFGTIIVVDAKSVSLTPSFAFNQNVTFDSVIYLDYTFSTYFPFSESQPLKLDDCGYMPPYFCLAYTSQSIHHRVGQVNIIGEPNKWAPISPQRIVNISYVSDVIVTLQGEPGYVGSFVYAINGKAKYTVFTIQPNGYGTINLTAGLPSLATRQPPAATRPRRSSTPGYYNSSTNVQSVTLFYIIMLTVTYLSS